MATPFVAPEIRLMSRTIVTIRARKRFFARMSTKVFREITLRHTLVVTSLNGAMKSFDLGMTTEVVEETTLH